MCRCKKSEKRGAFTLIELLVVIAIIGILMGLLFPAFNNMKAKAKSAQAEAATKALSAGIKAYFGEYGRMPGSKQVGNPDHVFMGEPAAADGSGGNPVKQSVVIDILRGIDTNANPNKVVYVDVPIKDLNGTDKDSNTYATGDGFYLDPWGNPYIIVMDLDFDGQVGGFRQYLGYDALDDYFKELSADKEGTFPGVTVLVMSYGPHPGQVSSLITAW